MATAGTDRSGTRRVLRARIGRTTDTVTVTKQTAAESGAGARDWAILERNTRGHGVVDVARIARDQREGNPNEIGLFTATYNERSKKKNKNKNIRTPMAQG